jgi:radical SAM protein with 4Fe4S-binding SPASM domain
MATRKGPQDQLSLSLTQIKEMIDEGTQYGQASMGFGGLWEPLMSNDLPELIAYGRDKGLVDVMFNTNGLLLSKNLSKDLIQSGLTRLMISLDAVNPQTYALMRPGSDLNQVEENIQDFIAQRQKAKSRLPLLRLSFCLTKINQSELPFFLERWENQVDFFSLQSYGRFDDQAPALFPDDFSYPSKPSGRCAQPFKRLLVRHDSQVLPCCDLSGLSLTLGQASQGLKQIWTAPTISNLREKLKNSPFEELPPTCQKCQSKFQA